MIITREIIVKTVYLGLLAETVITLFIINTLLSIILVLILATNRYSELEVTYIEQEQNNQQYLDADTVFQ